MSVVLIRLDPQLLDNSDLDIRSRLPELLAEKSGGGIADDGYDYAGPKPFLVLYLRVSDIDSALAYIIDVIEKEQVMGNDLRLGAVVAVKLEGQHEVVYPLKFQGAFLPNS